MTITLNAPEVRTFAALELRAEMTAGGLTELHGRAVPYDTATNVGWYEEIIAKGAFDKSIAEAARGLPLLLWHDSRTYPIGRSVDWDSTSAGLDGTWQLDDSEEAQRAARQASDGYLIGLSVGFVPVRSEWEYVDEDAWLAGEVDHCTRLEARLLEVSLTPTPAYAGAQVTLVRSAEGRSRDPRPHRRSLLASWQAEVERLRTG
jgi:HK97 family phage prohead protease